MDLDLSDDQTLFHETTVRFISGELPLERSRLLHDNPLGFDRDWLRASAELGWFAMLVPEDDGGGSVSGKGVLDAVIIAEEIGRHVQPGPFLSINVVAAAIAEQGTAEQRSALLPSLVAGEVVAGWAPTDEAGNWDSGAGLVATISDRGYTLSGTRGHVLDAAASAHLLVLASVDGAPVQFLIPTDAEGLEIEPLECLDLSRRLAHVHFNGVEVSATDQLGAIGDHDALDRQLQVALVLLCADTVGALDAMFDMAVEYSKDRIAFGRPIGSFQALKHMMADMGLHLETCKAGAVAAAHAVQDCRDDASEVTAMVSAYVGDLATEIAQLSLQIHGGIGYTWEHDLHLLMRRARANSALYGEPSWHRERVCALHGLGEQ